MKYVALLRAKLFAIFACCHSFIYVSDYTNTAKCDFSRLHYGYSFKFTITTLKSTISLSEFLCEGRFCRCMNSSLEAFNFKMINIDLVEKSYCSMSVCVCSCVCSCVYSSTSTLTSTNAQFVMNLQQTCNNAVSTACYPDVFTLLVPDSRQHVNALLATSDKLLNLINSLFTQSSNNFAILRQFN